MFFGDEHLGKAVAMLRESMDLSQKQLAHEVGVEPNTMNQYESGRRGMSEEVLFRIAGVLQRDPIEIWDLAYSIFRFNHFRERAERHGINVDELIARTETNPSEDTILELLDSLLGKARPLVTALLRFQSSARRTGGIGLVKVVVQAHRHRGARTRKAVRFSRRERLSPPEPR